MTRTIKPITDVENLVRELSENKVSALELLREAVSNAKDHKAQQMWIEISKGPRGEVSVLLMDNGEGMNDEGLAAFWGVGRSVKNDIAIGYKGHGTKLYFCCAALTVATASKTSGEVHWEAIRREDPSKQPDKLLDVVELEKMNTLYNRIKEVGLIAKTGTAVLIEGLRFKDAGKLLERVHIESYLDWFTIIGDIRSGLFNKRKDFHRVVLQNDGALSELRGSECPLRPLSVLLKINGDRDFNSLGFGNGKGKTEFYAAWAEDLAAYRNRPELLAMGHRFADHHEAPAAQYLKNDMTALCLTDSGNWTHGEFGLVMRIEGQRCQVETYREAIWSGHSGVYRFDDRFGLWLCKDYVPVCQNNDLLREAISDALGDKLRLELRSLRCWQIFINSQQFLPTANRNQISNLSEKRDAIAALLRDKLKEAFKKDSFREWIIRLSRAQRDRRKESELAHMDGRRDRMIAWVNDKRKHDAVEPMAIAGLKALDDSGSLLMPAPQSEQELFYLYSLLSARYEMPLHVLEYDATHGVDAIALLRTEALVRPRTSSFVRVEFKQEVSAQNSLDHFFDAIDVLICWKVTRTGPIFEEGSASEQGKLQRREKPVLQPAIDTHEIVYNTKAGERTIPVLQVSALFAGEVKPRRR